ncbi:hypothetical protein Gohar_013747, partial [Gossypium harknessii]|nr:hypothetical protein [Gossypium harknessii]
MKKLEDIIEIKQRTAKEVLEPPDGEIVKVNFDTSYQQRLSKAIFGINRYRYLSFRYVSGTANEVVHALATRGNGFETSMYWVEEILIVFEELSGVMDWKKQETSNVEILEENQSIRRLSLMQASPVLATSGGMLVMALTRHIF